MPGFKVPFRKGLKSLFLSINPFDMDIQSEKLQLIEWLARLNDTTTLKCFITLKKQQEKGWWDQLSDQEKIEIEEGLAQADRGEVISHKEVMAKYKKWR